MRHFSLAPQVDRQAVPAGPKLPARGQQQRPRLTAGRPRVVSSPARAAIIGHSAIMPVCAVRDNRIAVPDPAAGKPEPVALSTSALRAATVRSSKTSGVVLSGRPTLRVERTTVPVDTAEGGQVVRLRHLLRLNPPDGRSSHIEWQPEGHRRL